MRKALKRAGTIVVSAALFVAVIGVTPTPARNAAHVFQWVLVGEDGDGMNMASAANGDVLEITGVGTFEAPWRANGGGTLHHMTADGEMVGHARFAATRLISFRSFGNDPEEFPEDAFGGVAKIAVKIFPGDTKVKPFTGVLTVTCTIGNVPAGHEEGVQLSVPRVINFNHEAGGDTVFFSLPEMLRK